MRCALSLLPEGGNYRSESFRTGLRAAGFKLCPFSPEPGDVLLIWNRSERNEAKAQAFERAGASVLVVENGPLGKTWRGQKWFSLALGHHNGAGRWPDGGPHRWDSWNIGIKPPRATGGETVILGQRGIGEKGVASPENWEQVARTRYGGRIRPHPGAKGNTADLLHDLKDASRVVTWSSGAALLAAVEGIEVVSEFPQWIGRGVSADPLATFRRIAWAMWTVEEIESGDAFRCIFS